MTPQQQLIRMWQNDWCLFARQVFDATLDEEQKAILRSVQRNPKTSVASGTSRGKDFVAAVASLCFLYLTPRFDSNGNLVANTKIALTAPTGRQVEDIMMPEISRLYRKAVQKGFGLPGGRLNRTAIRTDYEEWFLTGFKADDNNHEAWSGFHAVNTMFVVTEATGVSDETFADIEGNLQNNSRLLLAFNPNTSVGYAAKSQSRGDWAKFQLNSLTAPNVVEKREVFSGQVNYEWVVDKLEHWCTKIREEEKREEYDDFCFEGQWYRPDDTFRKKVLGKFPKVSEDTLIPRQWLELAHQRYMHNAQEPKGNTPRVLGVDIAGMGRDATCFCERKGEMVYYFETHHSAGDADHMRVAGMITTKRKTHKDMYASIDTIGEGAGVFSRCREIDDKEYIISCKFSEAPKHGDKPLTDTTGQYTFLNMRAYLFWCVRDWLNPKNNTGAMIPPNDKFDEEAMEIKWVFRSDGRIQIEPKEDIKKRLGRSTDLFDSLANTFYPVRKRTPIDLNRLASLINR